MSQTIRRFAPRYRRRILGIGVIAFVVLFAVGAPIYTARIEDDLERRVPAELAALGITGVTVAFSGQDGTLTCEQPLADPEAALRAVNDVWGVWNVRIDRSCRVSSAPIVESSTTVPTTDMADDGSTATSDSTTVTTTESATVTVASLPSTSAPDFSTADDVVRTDPQFSLLAVLTTEAGVQGDLGGPGPITLFAPTNAAFEALSSDAVAQLRADPELLARVLRHHLVAGRVASGDLAPGPLTTLDEGDIAIAISDGVITIDDATVIDGDIETGNGVVHVVDRVLLPDDVDLTAPDVSAFVTARFDDGIVTLEGVVPGDVEVVALTSAAATGGTPERVRNQLELDAEGGVEAATVAQLTRLVTAMSTELVSGEAGFDGTELYVRGVFATEAARDAVQAVAGEVGVVAELTPRPDATAADAAALEAELNAFVLENPILFTPTSTVLTPESIVLIDQLAARSVELGGVTITVEGHTDSDGTASRNQSLSQQRAEAVAGALIERGLPSESVVAFGFGSQQPVLVDGVEDKQASRRVVFRVGATE